MLPGEKAARFQSVSDASPMNGSLSGPISIPKEPRKSRYSIAVVVSDSSSAIGMRETF